MKSRFLKSDERGQSKQPLLFYFIILFIFTSATGCRFSPLMINPSNQRLHSAAAFNAIHNPIIDLEPQFSCRDPLLVEADGVFYCYFTHVRQLPDRFRLNLAVSESRDLAHWSPPRLVTDSDAGFSSPGNIIEVNGRWIMSLQTYPVPPGKTYASEEARLWIMESSDKVHWSEPRPINPAGTPGQWSKSRRQIDPCLLYHEGQYYCFYKSSGAIGLMTSTDLEHWSEPLDGPVIGKHNTPDGATVENICIIRDEADYVMFFSRVGKGRGFGVARSTDLLTWRDIHYLDFPAIPWADNGPTAPMVLDLRKKSGRWLMVFHGDRIARNPHGGVLGLAWSIDLEHWKTLD